MSKSPSKRPLPLHWLFWTIGVVASMLSGLYLIYSPERFGLVFLLLLVSALFIHAGSSIHSAIKRYDADEKKKTQSSRLSKSTPIPSDRSLAASVTHYTNPADSEPKSQPVAVTPPMQHNTAVPYSYSWTAFPNSDLQKVSNFCVVDVETTGIKHRNNRIVQIALLKVIENDNIVDSFTSYVNPGMHIPAEASKINGIYDADVSDAPTYDSISDRVFDFLKGCTIVGHNVTFDLDFIADLVFLSGRHDPNELSLEYVDTYAYSRRILKDVPNYRLQTLLQHFGIDPGQAHSSDSDARATLKLFNILRQREKVDKANKLARRRAEREEEISMRRALYAASPLLEKRFCFSGEFTLPFESMVQLARSVGALVRDEVNTKTDYYVKGKMSQPPVWIQEQNENRAAELIADGTHIKIIDETEFLSMVAMAKKSVQDSHAQ